MKFIQTIIAFVSIYLFIGVILFLSLFMVWLSRYIPNMPTQTIASIKSTSGLLTYDSTSPASALETVFTRGSVKEQRLVGVTSTEQKALSMQYGGMKLPDFLMPLGFTSVVRLETISDGSQVPLFEVKEDWIDAIMQAVLGGRDRQFTKKLIVVASDTEKSYTVVVSNEDVTMYEN